jgi:hypothetical protein
VTQHMDALTLANEIRFRRADIKRELLTLPDGPSAARRAADLLMDPPDFLLGMDVAALIGSCRRFGPARVGRVLRMAQVSGLRKVRDLTERQRDALVATLRGLA